MKIINESKKVVGYDIQPQGTVACMVACAATCILAGGTMSATGAVFYLV
ncbi:MAG: hypothetical protein GXZ06_01715 [Tissierellia bacterium]|mgnify:CR=1 FL=1|nr:hypothetical protein [Tissierellia bacterium]